MGTDQFRPDRIVVDEEALRFHRGLAATAGLNRRRVYGLALEFAFQREDAFKTFLEERTNHE